MPGAPAENELHFPQEPEPKTELFGKRLGEDGKDNRPPDNNPETPSPKSPSPVLVGATTDTP